MSVLIRGAAVVSDPYFAVNDEEPIPGGTPVLLTLSRWQGEHAAFATPAPAFGVLISNTTEVGTLDPAILAADLIVLEFPGFADGRAYSQARLLREGLQYRGELRATGAAVVRDQLLGMSRCGIDSFQLRDDQSAEACIAALDEFSMAYQPALGELPRVRDLRRSAAG
ncbi:MAG: DUF934 domain-containing protein [Panacagrimonas sp.]